MGGTDQFEVNAEFERIARERGFYSQELMEEISEKGTCQGIEAVPEDVQKRFVVSYDIDPKWDVKIQAAFQDFTDNAVSKTINFPHAATSEEIGQVYLMAYQLNCKGITIYRDGSKDQVLSVGTGDKAAAHEDAEPVKKPQRQVQNFDHAVAASPVQQQEGEKYGKHEQHSTDGWQQPCIV